MHFCRHLLRLGAGEKELATDRDFSKAGRYVHLTTLVMICFDILNVCTHRMCNIAYPAASQVQIQVMQLRNVTQLAIHAFEPVTGTLVPDDPLSLLQRNRVNYTLSRRLKLLEEVSRLARTLVTPSEGGGAANGEITTTGASRFSHSISV